MNKEIFKQKIFNLKTLGYLMLIPVFAMAIILNISVFHILDNNKQMHELACVQNLTTNHFAVIPTYEVKKEEVKAPEIVIAPVNDKEDGQGRNRGQDNSKVRNIGDAKKQYETGGTSFGVDVSKYQGTINWAKVKQSGVDFAMIRAGYRGYETGKLVADPYVYQNIEGALKNGIHVGIYFYSVAKNEAEAREEALLTLEIIRGYNITYPVAYDLEDFNRYRLAGVSNAQLNKNAIAFLNTIRNAGYTPMLYGSKSTFGTIWSNSTLNSYKVWLAHYTAQTNYSGRYNMWQYTSSGTVNGISGRVDLNIAYFKLTTNPVYKAKDESEVSLDPNQKAIDNAGITNTNEQVVTTARINFRKSPTTSLDNIISLIESGVEVTKTGISSDGKWARIVYNNITGYVSNDYLMKKEEPVVVEPEQPQEDEGNTETP